jgi:molybdate transport system regulatory protein
VTARVKSIQTGDIMSLVKFDVSTPAEMASVLTTESVRDLGLEVGGEVQLIIKAIHVLPVKE